MERTPAMYLIATVPALFARINGGDTIFESISDPMTAVLLAIASILFFVIFGLSRITIYIFVALALAGPWALGLTHPLPGKNAGSVVIGAILTAVAGTMYEMWKRRKRA